MSARTRIPQDVAAMMLLMLDAEAQAADFRDKATRQSVFAEDAKRYAAKAAGLRLKVRAWMATTEGKMMLQRLVRRGC